MKYTLALKKLPFEPLKKQIIYVESSYDEAVNKYIQDNLEHLCVYCHLRGYEFCYFPKMFEKGIDEDVLFYNAPYANRDAQPESIGSDFLLRYMSHPENKELIPPSLIYLSKKMKEKPEKGETLFKAVSVTDQDEYPTIADIFDLRLKEIVKELFEGVESSSQDMFDFDDSDESLSYERKRRDANFSISEEKEKKEKKRPLRKIWVTFEEMLGGDEKPQPPKSADDRFEEESTQLSPEVKKEIKKMVVKQGVDALQLIQYIKSLEPLSRLRITKDFHIFVPDYGNKEIEMFPLHKAVFLLFLRHPEGIIFKHLPDYKEELMEIYSQLRPTGNREKMLETIEDATLPFGDSINICCSRIREAFVKKFKEHLARNYFITGERGEAKKITLPRDLVVWEE
ncbi:MAG: hypothetical protein IKU02_04450 [Bacteroidaceae bacterium]|nr:hypothetical protein [Bacteroidaceae bacterium]